MQKVYTVIPIIKNGIFLFHSNDNVLVNHGHRKGNHQIENNMYYIPDTINAIYNASKPLNFHLTLKLINYFAKEYFKIFICQSTILRKLFYIFEHCIHHRTLIKVSFEKKIELLTEMSLSPLVNLPRQSINKNQSIH